MNQQVSCFNKGISRLVLSAVLALLLPNVAFAYLGPGAGLGMIGSLIAVIVAVVVGVIGIILYPVRLIRKRFKKKQGDDKST